MPNEVVVTIKGDGAAPWVVVHGDTVQEATNLLDEATKGDLFQAAAESSTLIATATRVANALAAPARQDQPAQSQDQGYQYNRQSVQQNNTNQGPWTPPGGGGNFNGTPHPEGKTCPACGAGIVGKQPREKRMWTCPNQRSKGDGHYVEWLNG